MPPLSGSTTSATISKATRRALDPEQQQRYARDGYLFPFSVLEPSEVAGFRREVEALEPHLRGELPAPQPGQTHLHFRWAFDLATHPRVLDLVEDLIGPDILIHSTNLFCKHPNSPAFVSWHQDSYYWRQNAPRLVSAWVALSESTIENGCLRVIPGTHVGRLPHETRPHPDNMLSLTGLNVERAIDDAEAVDLVLEPGQMSLHHADLVHGSQPNRSSGKRIGFAIRYVDPSVRQERAHHAVVLARGEDRHGHYQLMDELPSLDHDQALAAHAAFWQRSERRPERPRATPAPQA